MTKTTIKTNIQQKTFNRKKIEQLYKKHSSAITTVNRINDATVLTQITIQKLFYTLHTSLKQCISVKRKKKKKHNNWKLPLSKLSIHRFISPIYPLYFHQCFNDGNNKTKKNLSAKPIANTKNAKASQTQ